MAMALSLSGELVPDRYHSILLVFLVIQRDLMIWINMSGKQCANRVKLAMKMIQR